MQKIMLNFLILIFSIKAISPICVENEEFCLKCHPLTNLCIKCNNEVLMPNDKGGCDGIKNCFVGINYCNQCNEQENLCAQCEQGFFPDKNGGCSYSSNCKISDKGKCLLCDSDFILIGDQYFSMCKYLKSDDLNHCKKINSIYGICEECEEGYYLNGGDKRCTTTENCYESTFEKCDFCVENYYLNKKTEKCLEKNNTNFNNCKITLDGEKCEQCEDNYFLTEDGFCVLTDFCKESENEICTQCMEGYYLSKNNYCSSDENCEEVEINTGLCKSCKSGFYLDLNENQCKSNTEQNNYRHCTMSLNECIECEKNYYLSSNSVCSPTEYCSEALNGKCIECEENYYLTLDNICTVIKGCIHTGNSQGCNECEDGYYYSFSERVCKESEGNFTNCRYTTWDQCDSCKDNYYLLKPEKKCYNNTEKGNFYKCKMSDKYGESCYECEKGYYLTTGDEKICVKMRGCKIAQDENVCLKCDTGFCYDKNKKSCFDNYNIENEKNKKYFGCEYTDEEGKFCDQCIEGYTFENDICINKKYCKEEKDGVCIECIEKSKSTGTNICLNKDLGCIEAQVNNCYKCDDLSNLYSCTECKEGFKLIVGFCL